MIDSIESMDQSLMLFLNGMHNEYMDVVMHYVSEGWFWMPVYFLVIFLIFKKYGFKGLSYFLIFAGLSILLSDRISVMAFKNVFLRYRPCHNETIGHLIHTVGDRCGGQYGFISSHATNFFSIAILMGLSLRRDHKWAMPLLLSWASFIAYSRIYLGVHYPLDILGGAMLGTTIGITCYWMFSRFTKNLLPSSNHR